MKIKVLGCYGGEMPGHRTTCLLINDNILLDAGAATGALTIEEQLKIDAIVLSHSHLDHVRDLGFIADNIFGQKDRPIDIYGLPETIANLRTHVLNNMVWPDFSQLPTPENSIISFNEIAENQPVEIEGITFTPVLVNHTIPTAGFIVANERKAFVFSGDTGPTEAIWEIAAGEQKIAAVFIEASFPDRMSQLAEISRHLTPRTAVEELKKLGRKDLPAYVFHMKPQYLGEIEADLEPGDFNIKVLAQGESIEI